MLFNWKFFPGTNLQDLNLDWIINFVKMIPSRLPKFSDHHTWLVYDYSTGEYYDSGEPTGGAGEPGEPGKSPIIGANGNWYTWSTETETYTDTGTRAQGVQGEPGAGVASGGVVGDVLVKASGVDYNTGWTATPPQMGSLAHINAGNTATPPDATGRIYNPGDYLVWNGQLYKVGDTAISEGGTLNPGTGGNISAVGIANEFAESQKIYPTVRVDSGSNSFIAYSKIAGIVTLQMRCSASDFQLTAWNSQLIGTLPSGFRPTIRISTPANVDRAEAIGAVFDVNTDGTVTFSPRFGTFTDTSDVANATICFVAT